MDPTIEVFIMVSGWLFIEFIIMRFDLEYSTTSFEPTKMRSTCWRFIEIIEIIKIIVIIGVKEGGIIDYGVNYIIIVDFYTHFFNEMIISSYARFRLCLF